MFKNIGHGLESSRTDGGEQHAVKADAIRELQSGAAVEVGRRTRGAAAKVDAIREQLRQSRAASAHESSKELISSQ